jgi:hypothetical protein
MAILEMAGFAGGAFLAHNLWPTKPDRVLVDDRIATATESILRLSELQ